MIKITSLTFKYPRSPQPALKDINFEIQPGTLTLVTGATGSGKSTLLRCLNGLVPHFSGGDIEGEIRVFDSNPIIEGPEIMAARVGFVFQEPETQFVFDVVEDEIAFALENAGVPREQIQRRVDHIIQYMDLEGIRFKNIHDISGGEKQKVAIAGALVDLPEVLVLDEPTSQLDPQSAHDLLSHLTKLKDELKLTIVISEHRLERLLPYTDSMAYLTPEHNLLFGTPQEILHKMQQVPPIIEIAKRLKLHPLPLRIQDFPEIQGYSVREIEEGKNEEPIAGQTCVLEVRELVTEFDKHKVLDRVDLQLFKGDVTALIGPNGAGKTTLLRSILGLIPSNGHRYLNGEDLDEKNLGEVIRDIAYLPQDPNDLLFAETVLDELKITLKNHDRSMDDADIAAFLTTFGLAEMQHSYPRDLSVGERQRTALAAITVHQPQIILLDEPTRGMDYHAKHALSQILKLWCSEGKAVLLVTHDIEFAAGLADRVTILEDGKISFTGSPKAAFSEFSKYRTQTAHLFPHTGWITPEDCLPYLKTIANSS